MAFYFSTEQHNIIINKCSQFGATKTSNNLLNSSTEYIGVSELESSLEGSGENGLAVDMQLTVWIALFVLFTPLT